LSKYLTGQVCLVFSSMTPKEFESKLAKYEMIDFASAGTRAP